MKDVAIVGGGMAGMATAGRLQAAGLSTVVFEAHGMPGGCAGYFRRRGFSFDVGATTLVDFEEGGVGAELLKTIDMSSISGEALSGYVAWLPTGSPDRVVLYRDRALWAEERRRAFGDTPAHRRLWMILDGMADALWTASRRGIALPIRGVGDAVHAMRSLGGSNLLLARYLTWTMGDLLRSLGLRRDGALTAVLAMLIEDTVHGTIDDAPLMNAALGVASNSRGVGLTRALGGMRGFWQAFAAHYQRMGGELRVGHPIEKIYDCKDRYRLTSPRGEWHARQVVSAVPIGLTAKIGPPAVADKLSRFVKRDAAAVGGAIAVFLGVPEDEVAGQEFTHHQLMQNYSGCLGNGNNMFVSVSSAGDTQSAPDGHRAVMISTHCELGDWEGLGDADYKQRKREAGQRLIEYARRVYPDLGTRPVVYEIGTPRTYERFTRRPRGAVGGVRLNLSNANQNAVPHDIGVRGFHLAGDTTWPGLGTVACVLGSRIVAGNVMQEAGKQRRPAFIQQEENDVNLDRAQRAAAASR